MPVKCDCYSVPSPGLVLNGGGGGGRSQLLRAPLTGGTHSDVTRHLRQEGTGNILAQTINHSFISHLHRLNVLTRLSYLLVFAV